MGDFFYYGQKDVIRQLNKLADSATVQQSYYGPLAAAPSTRPDGTARREGDRYFDTVTRAEKTWNGTTWFVPNLSAAQLAAADGTDYIGYAPLAGAPVKVTQRLRQFDSMFNRATQNRKILVFGSSVAYGYGSPTFNGWARRLAAALAPRGYTMVNKSIGGNKTTDLIGRFYADVVPENPGIVILGLSLANEGLLGIYKEAVYTQYITNMRRLVAMCREMGYKVIVTGVYGNNDYTAADYLYLKQADQELENSDIPYINFLGAIDDGTGKWRTGMSADAGHPNDDGYESMFRAIPLSLFDNVLSGLVCIPKAVNPHTIEVVSMLNGSIPVKYTSENGFGSFSVMCRIRRTATGPSGKPLICLEHSSLAYQSVRVRNSTDVLELAIGDSNGIVTDVATSTLNEYSVIITFDYFSNIWKLYVDGVLKGTIVFSPVQGQAYDTVAFGGRSDSAGFNSNGYEFSDFAVWRVALNQEQVADAAQGRISKASLNLYAPVIDTLVENGSRLINLAPSGTYGRVLASGVYTFPSHRLVTTPTPNARVKTKSNGYLDISLLDPAQPITASLLAGGVITAPGSLNVGLANVGTQGDARMIVTNNAVFYKVDGAQGSALGAALQMRAHTITGRSVNVAGTVNTAGNDYAEYMHKSVVCGTVLAGQIVGITDENTLSDKWSDSVMFAIKSTAPSFVGGDTWADSLGIRPIPTAGDSPEMPVISENTDDAEREAQMLQYDADMADYAVALQMDIDAETVFNTSLEVARQRVDRIAIAGRVPVNVLGAQPGDYIVPVQDGAGIKGIAVHGDDLSMQQYLRAVGRVISIEADGRAYVMVKAV
ncbi:MULTISPECIES: GDSL-type esterase/lipase family protein [unclassified Janthinobacterium]|uniref:GDSL-type esterase/lipase family protein n=1 Tax=unclassified Janthinobacterium TaxID=2610881 RepID=UPI0008892ECF|nr:MULTISPECIES: GDSL-type esterase/lipase family protein [unclassified Janthinobacterium]SDA37985.1 Lysophospholipase L1 [Janthinobacterium sp. 551a]SFA76173.1 Lysophospholipase L1 [Janthinobacterium sp. 344]